MTTVDGSGIVVPREIAISMAQQMVEAGRAGETIGSLANRMHALISRELAGSKSVRFAANGGGWLVDLSDVTGDVQYGIIQRDSNGGRILSNVVDESEAQMLIGAAGSLPDEERPSEAPVAREVQVEKRVVAEKPQPQNGDPRLVIWWSTDEANSGSAKKQDGQSPDGVERCTYETVQQRVLQLLMSGAEVEVWDGVRTPKIKVDL